MGNMQRVAQYNDRIAADVAKSALAANGIVAVISGGDLGGTVPYLAATFGIDLLVNEEDLKAAHEILRELEPQDAAAEGRESARGLFDTKGLRIFRRVLLLLWLIPIGGIFAATVFERFAVGWPLAVWVISWCTAVSATFLYLAAKGRARRRYVLSED